MMKFTALAILPLTLFACTGPYQAPYGAVILEVEEFSLVPTSAHISQDGVGTLLFGDLVVYDEVNEVPLNDIEVEILTGWSGVYVLPESAIKLVQYPERPSDVEDGTATTAEYCDIDEDGYIDPSAPDWCSWWWDIESSAFYEFGGDYAMTSQNFQPTYMIGATDNRGILRFYLYVDSMPNEGDGESVIFSSSSCWISIGVDTLLVEITTGS